MDKEIGIKITNVDKDTNTNGVLGDVVLSEDDNDECHCFDKCKNPLKNKYCDDSMVGSQYCFEE